MIMAKKDRLNNIEDPVFAFMSSASDSKNDSSATDKRTDKKSSASVGTKAVPAKAEEESSVSEAAPVPALLKRPERERLTKKFMILLPESLYIKLFNASVEDDKSLNKYILDVLRAHADEKGL